MEAAMASSHHGHMPSGGRSMAISAWLTGVYFVIEMGIGLWTGLIAVILDAFHTFSAVDAERLRGPTDTSPKTRVSLGSNPGSGPPPGATRVGSAAMNGRAVAAPAICGEGQKRAQITCGEVE